MQDQINQLESDFANFTQKVGRLQGEYSTLESQQNTSLLAIERCKENELIYTQAVELLSLVQKVTRDKIKESFEMIVTHALNYIFESDKYSFQLVFGRRGNLQELDFNVRTPDKDEAMDLLTTSGGGVINIVSLVLRIVLMEICQPKINGYILADEAFANLSAEYQPKASEFLAEINKRFKRQIIMITHSNEFIENSNYNKIEIK